MYYADYHTHSRLSPDSDAPLLDMAEAAARAGLSELCITDHYDLVEMDGTPRTQPLDWPAAVAQWEEVRRRMAGRLILKLGVEFGSPTYDHTAARRTLDQSLLDFVIGSLHNYSPEAGGADFYLGDYTSPEICYAALDDYFAHMARLAPLPFYDSLGHIIYPLRYMCMRDGQSVSLDRYMDAIREILKTVVETGHGIEVNTYNGRTVSDWRPILDLYREVGGEILTVGSDAHAPRNVAGCLCAHRGGRVPVRGGLRAAKAGLYSAVKGGPRCDVESKNLEVFYHDCTRFRSRRIWPEAAHQGLS